MRRDLTADAANPQKGIAMVLNPILRLPLIDVLRAEFALSLQQLYGVCTIGGFLTAWRRPENRRLMENLFDSPQQAQHARAAFAAWLNDAALPQASLAGQTWWRADPLALPVLPSSSSKTV